MADNTINVLVKMVGDAKSSGNIGVSNSGGLDKNVIKSLETAISKINTSLAAFSKATGENVKHLKKASSMSSASANTKLITDSNNQASKARTLASTLNRQNIIEQNISREKISQAKMDLLLKKREFKEQDNRIKDSKLLGATLVGISFAGSKLATAYANQASLLNSSASNVGMGYIANQNQIRDTVSNIGAGALTAAGFMLGGPVGAGAGALASIPLSYYTKSENEKDLFKGRIGNASWRSQFMGLGQAGKNTASSIVTGSELFDNKVSTPLTGVYSSLLKDKSPFINSAEGILPSLQSGTDLSKTSSKDIATQIKQFAAAGLITGTSDGGVAKLANSIALATYNKGGGKETTKLLNEAVNIFSTYGGDLPAIVGQAVSLYRGGNVGSMDEALLQSARMQTATSSVAAGMVNYQTGGVANRFIKDQISRMLGVDYKGAIAGDPESKAGIEKLAKLQGDKLTPQAMLLEQMSGADIATLQKGGFGQIRNKIDNGNLVERTANLEKDSGISPITAQGFKEQQSWMVNAQTLDVKAQSVIINAPTVQMMGNMFNSMNADTNNAWGAHLDGKK